MQGLVKRMVWPFVPKRLYGHVVYRRRWHQAPHTYAEEFAALAPLLTDEKNVIDCGAHMGIFARFFAERSLAVDEYEPNPYLYDILSRELSRERSLPRCRDLGSRRQARAGAAPQP